MANKVLETELSSDLKPLNTLIKAFPDVRFHFTRSVAKSSRTVLRSIVSGIGSPINLQAYPKDSRGSYTIRSRVGKKGDLTTITSYPLNLFEFGRGLRDGNRESGKHIVTGLFKSKLDSRLQTIVDNSGRKILDPAFRSAS